MKAVVIDSNGMYVTDIPIYDPNIKYELPLGYSIITNPVPEGFFHPKWDGAQWAEGLTEQEIKELSHPSPNPDWSGLLEWLMPPNELGSKAYAKAKTDNKTNAIWTALQTTLASTRNIERLALLLSEIIPAVGYIPVEVQSFQQKLNELNFNIDLMNNS